MKTKRKKGLIHKKVNEWHLLVVVIFLGLVANEVYKSVQRADGTTNYNYTRSF